VLCIAAAGRAGNLLMVCCGAGVSGSRDEAYHEDRIKHHEERYSACLRIVRKGAARKTRARCTRHTR
jgi:hypothetical protein